MPSCGRGATLIPHVGEGAFVVHRFVTGEQLVYRLFLRFVRGLSGDNAPPEPGIRRAFQGDELVERTTFRGRALVCRIRELTSRICANPGHPLVLWSDIAHSSSGI